MHYPPENASIMLLARMVAVVNQANDKEEALAMFSQFCHRTVSNDTHEIVHYLLGEKFVGQIDILQQMMREALNTEYTAHVCNIHIYIIVICTLMLTRIDAFSGSHRMVLEVY